MYALVFVVTLLLTFLGSTQAAPAQPLEVRDSGVSQAVYDDLVIYAKYSSAVYQPFCPRPLGSWMIKAVSFEGSFPRLDVLHVHQFDTKGTQGFVARDDARKEIIVAFRGSFEIVDILIGTFGFVDPSNISKHGHCVDIQIILTPLSTPGVSNVGSAHVHTGFQKAYNFVTDEVQSLMKSQIDAYPSYKLVVTGTRI